MKKSFILGLAVSITMALPATAQDMDAAVKARQGQMSVIGYNIGLLGAMAKGELAYDADLATGAAANLAAAASMSSAAMWPEGSDNGANAVTRAQPAIWSDWAGFEKQFDAMLTAASAAAESVGSGAEALGPALGAIGASCKGCHQDYRGPRR